MLIANYRWLPCLLALDQWVKMRGDLVGDG
jgi:hypothetical protein